MRFRSISNSSARKRQCASDLRRRCLAPAASAANESMLRMMSSSSFAVLQNDHSVARACSQCANALAAFFNPTDPAALAASSQASEDESGDMSRAGKLRCFNEDNVGRRTRDRCAWRACKDRARLRDRQLFLCPNSLPRRSMAIPASCTCQAGLRDRTPLLFTNSLRQELAATSRGETPTTQPQDAGGRPR